MHPSNSMSPPHKLPILNLNLFTNLAINPS